MKEATPKSQDAEREAPVLILLSTGKYSAYSVQGAFRPLRDFTMGEAADAFRAQFKPEHDWSQPDPYAFAAWLVTAGYIEDAPTNEVHLGSYGQIELSKEAAAEPIRATPAPVPAEPSKGEREAFEAEMGNLVELRPSATSDWTYDCTRAEYAWKGWSRRAALAAPVPASPVSDEVTRLRELAAVCYAGLGGECDLPEPWLDALLEAAEGRPFTTEGLLPFTSPVSAAALRIGGRYNWKNQPERLVYMGLCEPRNGRWHQFAKVDAPGVVWCEVLDSDLSRFEETQAVSAAAPEAVAEVAYGKYGNRLMWAYDGAQESIPIGTKLFTHPPAASEREGEDAARYRLLRRGQHWSMIDGIGDTLRGEQLDAAIDVQRLGREKENGNG